MAQVDSLLIDDSGQLALPYGTREQRVEAPSAGSMRVNSDFSELEFVGLDGDSWRSSSSNNPPGFISEGLVLHLDAGHPGSFREYPTVNLIGNPDFLSGTTGFSTNSGNISIDVGTYFGRPNVMRMTRVQGAGGYIGIRSSSTISASPSTQYSAQIMVYQEEATSRNIRYYFAERRSDNSIINYRHYISITPSSPVGEWFLMTTGWTSASDAHNYQCMFFDWDTTASTKDDTIYIDFVQFEVSPSPTAFVNGTRTGSYGTGSGIKDLSEKNNHAVIIGRPGITSDNGGGLELTSSSMSLTVKHDPNSMDFSDAQTIAMWLEPATGSTSARRNPYNQAYGGPGTITHETNGAFNYFWGTHGGNSTPYSSLNSTFTVGSNELAFILATRNQTLNTCQWYKNGVLGNTGTAGGYASTANGTSEILIGVGYTSNFLGKIYQIMVYNKYFTEEDAVRLFNSTRDRYGI